MSRMMALGLAVATFALGALVGVLVFIWTVGGSGEPSQPVSAPTLSLDTAATDNTAGDPWVQIQADVSQLSTQVAALSEGAGDDRAIYALVTEVAQLSDHISSLSGETAATPIAQAATSTPLPEQPATAVSEAPGAAPAESTRTLYRIAPEQSQVRFILHEELRGVPTVVTGITNQIGGDVIVDFGNPADSEIGTIQINARTLATDSEMRNRTIRGQILQSSQDEYEFINFVPTGLSGLPDSAAVGDTVTFQIDGDLTVRNITQPVTFAATVTLVSDSEISGSAQATVQRSQFNLEIPNVPGVANVTEDVTLEIDFVALQVEA